MQQQQFCVQKIILIYLFILVFKYIFEGFTLLVFKYIYEVEGVCLVEQLSKLAVVDILLFIASLPAFVKCHCLSAYIHACLLALPAVC